MCGDRKTGVLAWNRICGHGKHDGRHVLGEHLRRSTRRNLADQEAELMARHDPGVPDLSWSKGIPYRKDEGAKGRESEAEWHSRTAPPGRSGGKVQKIDDGKRVV